jgi:hypothetical protein
MNRASRTSIGREKLLSLGVPIEYHGQAKHYAGVMQSLNMAAPQIEAAIRFGAEFQGSPQEFIAQFDRLCAQKGIAPNFASLSESWLDQVNTRGFDNMPPVPAPPVTNADRSRLAQIQAEMRKPRGDSDYWGDPAIRDEYQALLERMESGESAPPAPRHDDAARKAELQALMRDRTSAYWREETGLSAEYRAILERESGGTGEALAPSEASSHSGSQGAPQAASSAVPSTEYTGATA